MGHYKWEQRTALDASLPLATVDTPTLVAHKTLVMIRTLLQIHNAVPLEAKQQTLDILPVPVANRGDLGRERTLMKENESRFLVVDCETRLGTDVASA